MGLVTASKGVRKQKGPMLGQRAFRGYATVYIPLQPNQVRDRYMCIPCDEGLSQPPWDTPKESTLTIYSKHYLCIKKNSTPLGTLTQVLTCVYHSVSHLSWCHLCVLNPRVTSII